MDAQDIAQWLIDNPQAWFQLAGLVAEQKPDYARQIAQAFDDQAFLDCAKTIVQSFEDKTSLEDWLDTNVA